MGSRICGTAASTFEALGTRDREILTDVIQTYVTSGRPVSSRAVSKHRRHKLSAATIRNVMSDLEEAGLLLQPHTSAGRVPTEAAYRLYVECLMEQQCLSVEERRYIEENLRQAGSDGDGLMTAASELLSELSHQVGVVLKPAVEETVLKAIDFVLLSEKRVLCVVVSTAAFIDNVVIESDELLTREDLQRISNYMNDNFVGLTLPAIRERLLGLMARERSDVDQQLARTIDLARKAVSRTETTSVLVRGARGLLDQPELSDVNRVQRMLDTFADKARMVSLLNECLTNDGVRVFIGADSELTSELEFSLVATCYGIERHTLGTVGILGPSRMEYARIVSLVHFLGHTLSDTLAVTTKA